MNSALLLKSKIPFAAQRDLFVGVAGFEPATSWSQTRRDDRATLHPEEAERQGLEPWRQLPADRLAICSVTTPAPLRCKQVDLFCGCKCNFSFRIAQLNAIFFEVFFTLPRKTVHCQRSVTDMTLRGME